MEDLLLPTKRVQIGPHALDGDLVVPPQARGLVVFAPGSGSTRRNPQYQQMARALHEHDLGTLLFDLLPAQSAAELGTNAKLLGESLIDVVDWLDRRPALAALPLGLLGAGTGAAAALAAAAARPQRVGAVVSCSGRLDPVLKKLPQVAVPTLLIVGGADTAVVAVNRDALARLSGLHELVLVPRAGFVLEQPKSLDRVNELASRWFALHLPARTKGVRHGLPTAPSPRLAVPAFTDFRLRRVRPRRIGRPAAAMQ